MIIILSYFMKEKESRNFIKTFNNLDLLNKNFKEKIFKN